MDNPPAKKEMPEDKLQLRSEMAQEILSHHPGFMENWALFIFLGILLLLLAGTWFIKYPDTIQARATLTADNAPKEIIPRQDGRLVRLFVQGNEAVHKNEILGWIESTADHPEVIDLSRKVDRSTVLLNAGKPAAVSGLFDRPYNNLGEIQQAYQSFTTALQQFNDYMVNGFYTHKKEMLENDIGSINSTNRTIQSQKALTQQDLKLAEESFKMNRSLFEEKVLSREELRTEKSKFVNKQMALPQLEASLLSNESQKREKLKEIQQLDHDREQETMVFRQALQSLKSAIDDWKMHYLIQSPIEGKVVFIMPLQENQYLRQGTLLGYINPSGTRFYAEANLPQENFGKIDTGLKVQLRFDAYPYQEVGFVDGTVSYVSNVASDSGFLATIRMDKGLITNNNRPIPYKNGLKAQALVITKNMRLLERLWYNINKMTSVGK